MVHELANHFFQGGEPEGMLGKAGDESEVGAAGLMKGFVATDPDFFEGFEAVRNEGRAHHKELFDAARGEFRKILICVGLQPGIAQQTGLEGDGIFFFGDAGLLDEGGNRLETLGAVASGMGGVRSFTAVFRSQAVGPGRIGFLDLALRQAVEAE